MKAHYQCCKCKHRWEGKPGPTNYKSTVREHCQKCSEEYEENPGFCNHTRCPKCGCIRLNWLNWKKVVRTVYEQDFDKEKHRWK